MCLVGANTRLIGNDLRRRGFGLLLLFLGRHGSRGGETEDEVNALGEEGKRVDRVN